MKNEKLKNRRMLFGMVAILILILIFFRQLFTATLPFAAGFLAACALHGPARNLSLKFHIRYRAAAIGLTVLSVSVLMGLFGFLLWQTISEIGAFAMETLKLANLNASNCS